MRSPIKALPTKHLSVRASVPFIRERHLRILEGRPVASTITVLQS